MSKNRCDGLETRRRLLDAAGVVFAAKGFHNATTADICRIAEANIAAVNYHFGSKEKLYVEAWRHVFDRSIEAYPPDGGVSPTAPAGERLGGQILAIMHRIMDPDSVDFDIALSETANPTGLLSEVMHQSLDPLHKTIDGVVRELLGPDAVEQQVQLCTMSLLGQCYGPLIHVRHHKKISSERKHSDMPMEEVGVEAIANHILSFSLAGIRRIRSSRRKCIKRKKS